MMMLYALALALEYELELHAIAKLSEDSIKKRGDQEMVGAILFDTPSMAQVWSLPQIMQELWIKHHNAFTNSTQMSPYLFQRAPWEVKACH